MGKGGGKAKRVRLDELLVARGLADSRSLAKALILGGKVRTGTQVLDKAGKEYPEDLPLELESPPKYVSRGGEKLEGFLTQFPIAVEGRTVLDVGASTGGFTDCLLQMGAQSSCCVDVGHGQLHYKLQKDERVTNLEKVNARSLHAGQLPRSTFDIIVMDLSFISLTKVLPAVWPLLAPGGHLIALIKPQFEADKAEVDRGRGVIRDNEVRAATVEKIRTFISSELAGAESFGFCESPITGADGNVEYLIGLHRGGE